MESQYVSQKEIKLKYSYTFCTYSICSIYSCQRQCQKLKSLAISRHKAVDGFMGIINLLRRGPCPFATKVETQLRLIFAQCQLSWPWLLEFAYHRQMSAKKTILQQRRFIFSLWFPFGLATGELRKENRWPHVCCKATRSIISILLCMIYIMFTY